MLFSKTRYMGKPTYVMREIEQRVLT